MSVQCNCRVLAFSGTGADPVFVVGTFSRRGVAYVDVVPLRRMWRPLGQIMFRARFAAVRSVRQTEVGKVGLHFALHSLLA